MSGDEPEPEREFDCETLDVFLEQLCGAGDLSETQCSFFEVNICAVSPEEQEKLCRNGYAEEFIRQFPCYCDDKCLTQRGATVATSFLALSLLTGLLCVFLRHCRKPVPDGEIEERLSVTDKPDPRVNQCSINSFKWIPFVTSVVLSLWFLVSTSLVIRWHGDPTVSGFAVAYMMVSTTFMVFWLLFSIVLIINGARGLYLVKRELGNKDVIKHTDTVHHIVILPNYKEEIDMIRATILRLANQSHMSVKDNVTVVLAMEQGEEGYWEKGMLLRDEFLPLFRDVVVTCHPRLHGEQPGKSSNMKWSYTALRAFATCCGGDGVSSRATNDVEEALNGEGTTKGPEANINYAEDSDEYFKHPDLIARRMASPNFTFDPERTVMTLMDADALSHPRFLATLGKKFEETAGPTKHLRFWQCPVAFYENLNEIDFVNRAATIIFAFNELANTGVVDLGLVGSNPRVPVNTYSMSWRLFDLIEGGDNFVVADESHNLFKAFHLSKGLVRLDPIFLPISVYNVTSDNFVEGFIARFTQIKRWMYGNSFEFSFWHGRYLGCSRSPNWHVPMLDKLPVLWRLLIFSSFNLVQPLFFALYGLSWAFYLKTPYFQSLSTIFVTFIMTTFMVINVSIFVMHWFYVSELNIKAIKKWPVWKKICWTIFDAIIGVGAATIFFIYFAGIAANGQLLFAGGLQWGTEGRAKKSQEEEAPTPDRKRRSEVTMHSARSAVELLKESLESSSSKCTILDS